MNDATKRTLRRAAVGYCGIYAAEGSAANLLAPLWKTAQGPFGTQDAAKWENFTRWMQANGLLASPVKAEDAFTNCFHGSN